MESSKVSKIRKKNSTPRKKAVEKNDSELQIVGELLFGSLPSIEPETIVTEPVQEAVPEPSNADSTPVVEAVVSPVVEEPVYSSTSKSTPKPIPQPVAAVSTSFFSRPIPMVYSLGFTALTVCLVVFVLQILPEKTSETVSETAPTVKTFETGAAVTPVPPVDFFNNLPEENTVVTTAPVFPEPQEEAALPEYQPAEEMEDEMPQFNASLAYVENPATAPVNAPVGGNVPADFASEESYPVFNASDAMPQTAPVEENIFNNSQTVQYSTGSTMDEIPVYNGTATCVPASPAIGNQANFAAPAPRKLAPPPAAPTHTEVEADAAYPSFDPGLGVEGSLPVSYN